MNNYWGPSTQWWKVRSNGTSSVDTYLLYAWRERTRATRPFIIDQHVNDIYPRHIRSSLELRVEYKKKQYTLHSRKLYRKVRIYT